MCMCVSVCVCVCVCVCVSFSPVCSFSLLVACALGSTVLVGAWLPLSVGIEIVLSKTSITAL